MQKLYVDFDNTIADTSAAFLETYSSLYGEVGKRETLFWDFRDCNVDPTKIMPIFSSELFFHNLKPYDGAVEALLKLSEITEVNIVTIGTYANISEKLKIMEKWGLSKSVGMIPIVKPNNKKVYMNKEIIPNGIIIDDHPDNLDSSNAEYRLLFSHKGLPYDWQKGRRPYMTQWDKATVSKIMQLVMEG